VITLIKKSTHNDRKQGDYVKGTQLIQSTIIAGVNDQAAMLRR